MSHPLCSPPTNTYTAAGSGYKGLFSQFTFPKTWFAGNDNKIKARRRSTRTDRTQLHKSKY